MAQHWDAVYGRTAVTEVSWFQTEPAVSLDLIEAAGVGPDEPVIDVGGGASTLVDRLFDHGYHDITVLDVAAPALAAAQARLAERAALVRWVSADVLEWTPPTTYALWHDRAVFHFLIEAADRDRYRATLDRALGPGGQVVIGTFAADGPTQCSGLPTGRYDAAGLAAEFSGYRVERTAREEHHTPAGFVQPFTWLLLTRTS
jgi:ubiquinone/menaquinone biosynthesis C-methylase UbiE